MAHSKFIVIKCPACGEKFEAEREEEACFISCPECDMQVKISGTHDRKSRSPRRMTPAASIPSRRHQERVQFSDLAAGPIDLEAARKRAVERMENEHLVIDDDDESEAAEHEADRVSRETEKAEASAEESTVKAPPRSGIERRAAKLEERAAKLEERAARLSKLRSEREEENKLKAEAEATEAAPETPDEAAAGASDRESTADKSPKAPAERGTKRGQGGAAKGEPRAKPQGDPASRSEGKAGEEADSGELEKVEVRSTGERRRLKRAPKADVPEPRGRPGAPRYVDDLRMEIAKEPIPASVTPKQEFDERKITEGSQWRRHNPSRTDDPDWESDEEPEAEHLYPYQKRRRLALWTVAGLVALFCVVAGYQFILAQLGWLTPVGPTEDVAPLVQDPAERWSNAEMFAQAQPVIEAFLSSTSNEDALQYVRFPGKVARFMVRHYIAGSFQPVSVHSLGPSGECRVDDDGVFFLVPVVLEDFSEKVIALEIPDDTGTSEWLIDWESWVGYSEMGFAELQLRMPQEPVRVRCYMIEDFYYNYAFTEDRYRSVKLFDASREHQLWGYIEKDSETYQQAALAFGLKEQAGEQKVTLQVRFPAESENESNDQLEITDFALSWVVRK